MHHLWNMSEICAFTFITILIVADMCENDKREKANIILCIIALIVLDHRNGQSNVT